MRIYCSSVEHKGVGNGQSRSPPKLRAEGEGQQHAIMNVRKGVNS